jgi:hypothetical protein
MKSEIICDDTTDDNIIRLGGMDSDSDLDGRLEGLIELQNSDGELMVSCKCFQLGSDDRQHCFSVLLL